MQVLIVCESESVKQKLNVAIREKGAKHSYKVVASGEGKVNAAVTTALEINDDPGKYDCVVSVGAALGGPFCEAGTFVIPNKVALWDANMPVNLDEDKEFELGGVDDITVLSGDTEVTDNNYESAVGLYGKNVCFDSITWPIAYVAEDYGIETLAIKYLGVIGDNASLVSVIDYIESAE